jgi:hypothetical protein
MDEIRDIVSSIVRGCNHGGIPVSEVLAAFVAKTVSSTHKYTKTVDKLKLYIFNAKDFGK